MKKTFLYLLLLAGVFSLQSCLDYDEPGDEFTSDTQVDNGKKVAPFNGVEVAPVEEETAL